MDVKQNQGVWEVFCNGKSERTDFPDQHTLLHVCHHVDAVLEKGTTIIAGYGVWECSGEVRMDVGQNHGVWELFRCIKSERIYFLA